MPVIRCAWADMARPGETASTALTKANHDGSHVVGYLENVILPYGQKDAHDETTTD
ncbi:MAG: hypothetical protein KAS72_07685 [Phycisphaerales bacterium]|nr:hypothetical protein [Phycisphaerales bacterium]